MYGSACVHVCTYVGTHVCVLRGEEDSLHTQASHLLPYPHTRWRVKPKHAPRELCMRSAVGDLTY